MENKKILLVGYYGFADGYLAGGKGLIDLGYEVAFFPLIDFKNQKGDINDLINIINGINKIEKSYINYKNDSPNKPCDICLWWHSNSHLDMDILLKLKQNTKSKYYQLNWDPSYSDKNNHNHWKENLKNILSDTNFFDKIITCNANIIKYLLPKYKTTNSVIHFNPGYHPSMSYFEEIDKYKCDVSIICTSLYEDTKLWCNTKICRKNIVDVIYSNPNINFHIYGPEKFKSLYPRAYKGFIPYKDCYKVFSNSKINLNIAPYGDNLNDIVNGGNKICMSERCPQILACKGLMICNTNLTPLLIPDQDYIKIDSIPHLMNRVIDILNNNEKYDKIRENGFKKAEKYLQWKDIFSNVF